MTTDATAIRDAIFALVQGLPGYTTFKKTPVRQITLADCPCVSVILGDETAAADEDATAGPPHFVHEATYHVSVLRGLADAATLDGQIDVDVDAIQTVLLCNVALNRMFEGVTSMRRSRAYPQDGETYFVELRLELTVQFRTLWNPVILDDFTGMDVQSMPQGSPTTLAEWIALAITTPGNPTPIETTIDVETDP